MNGNPVWSPDGGRIIFASSRDGISNLYSKPTSGAKNEELLLKSSEDKRPTSWSSDGRFLLYTVIDPKTKGDLWVLPLERDSKPLLFLRTEYNELDACFSPDMRWVAYTSDASGSNEIYVREFSPKSGGASSDSSGQWLISQGGGRQARWRADGKELYYRSPDDKVMAVEITAGTVFQAGTPKPLFPARFSSEPGSAYWSYWDVKSDGNRFLININADVSSASPITVITNWTAGLK